MMVVDDRSPVIDIALSTVRLSEYKPAGMWTSSPVWAASMQPWIVGPQAPPTVSTSASGLAAGAAQATPAGCPASTNTAAEASRPIAAEVNIARIRWSMRAPREAAQEAPVAGTASFRPASHYPNAERCQRHPPIITQSPVTRPQLA